MKNHRACFRLLILASLCIGMAGCKNSPQPPLPMETRPPQASATPLPASATPTLIPDTATPTQTLTITPSPRPTETLAPTSTQSSTPTPTPTTAPSPTTTSTQPPAATPTEVPTSAPVGIQPGIYGAEGCASIELDKFAIVSWCIVGVSVTHDFNIVVRVAWETTYTVYKGSEVHNPDVYLIDFYGNLYRAVAWGEDAAKRVILRKGETHYGTYTFPQPVPGATKFSLHGHKGALIEGLVLEKPMIYLLAFALKSAPLALEYRSDLWELVASDEGASIRHMAIPRCEIREGNSAEIKGKYKNQISIGAITYDIYGWLEDEYGVREYVYVSGLDEFESEVKPLVLVTIPFDNQEACLNAASEVLSKLYMLEP